MDQLISEFPAAHPAVRSHGACYLIHFSLPLQDTLQPTQPELLHFRLLMLLL